MSVWHNSVLLRESINLLGVNLGQNIVDATLGAGGHSKEFIKIIGKNGSYLGIDIDREAIDHFEKLITKLKLKTKIMRLVNDNYRNIDEILKQEKFPPPDVIFADLGLSSSQIDTFMSFKEEGELDMRLNKDLKVTAADLVNGLYAHELENMFTKNSDEPLAHLIAKAIVTARKISPIKTKQQLTKIIQSVSDRVKNTNARADHSAARIFQSLRIAVNDEYGAIDQFIRKAFESLKKDGRLGLISFHSGEDRIVKHNFQKLIKENKADWGSKLCTPGEEEIKKNKRSKGAKLRIIVKK